MTSLTGNKNNFIMAEASKNLQDNDAFSKFLGEQKEERKQYNILKYNWQQQGKMNGLDFKYQNLMNTHPDIKNYNDTYGDPNYVKKSSE
jgi:dTDP-4-dehydrorhamnose reductase